MPATIAEIRRAVTAPREQYLRQNEGRIRSLALPQNTSDPVIATPWYLCIFSEDDVVRAELSCPVECTGGYLSNFRERIILLGDEGNAPIKRIDPVSDGGEDFAVEVTRKSV